jgi:hypothetical protein
MARDWRISRRSHAKLRNSAWSRKILLRWMPLGLMAQAAMAAISLAT